MRATPVPRQTSNPLNKEVAYSPVTSQSTSQLVVLSAMHGLFFFLQLYLIADSVTRPDQARHCENL